MYFFTGRFADGRLLLMEMTDLLQHMFIIEPLLCSFFIPVKKDVILGPIVLVECNAPSLSTIRKSAAIFVEKNESRLSVVVRTSLTSCFEALKKLWFLKLKSAFKLRGEMLNVKSSAYFHKFVHGLANKTVNKRICLQLSSLRSFN